MPKPSEKSLLGVRAFTRPLLMVNPRAGGQQKRGRVPERRPKVGVWIHYYYGLSLDDHISLAADSGLRTIRSYDIGYSERVVPALKRAGMSLLAGLHVDAEALA